MREETGRTVYQRPDGSWAIRLNSDERPSSVHRTLLEAERFAKELLRNEGGGVLITALGWGETVLRKRTVQG